MSLDATRWAWSQRIPKNAPVRPSAIKLVLLSMADRADEHNNCFPSVRRLEADTELNRKTIISALSWLKEVRLIEDTGERKGRTKQVIVYCLLGVDNRENTVFIPSETKEKGSSAPQPTVESRKSTENGPLEKPDQLQAPAPDTLEQSPIRNSTEYGTVPNKFDNSTENGTPKESQIRDTESTITKPIIEPSAKPCAGVVSSQEKLVGKSGKALNKTESVLFLELWNAYNHKKDRAKAIDAFKKLIVPMFGKDSEENRKTLAMLLASIKSAVASRANMDPNKTPLYFERWITGRRWEDEQSTGQPAQANEDEDAPLWKQKGFQSFEAFTEFNIKHSDYTTLKAIKDKSPIQEKLFQEVRDYLNNNRPVSQEAQS